MEDTLIEYNTAVLAKKKGFGENCNAWYFINSELIIEKCSHDQFGIGGFLAPTQSLLAKWLREVHNIEVGVMRYTYSGGIYQGRKYMWYVDQYDPKYNHEIEEDDNYWILNERQSQGYEFNTYEQAYEKGLQEALKLIK